MKKNFLSIFTIMTLVAALFMLCSCNPENNTQNADPSASVNWHDAPFAGFKIDEYLGCITEVKDETPAINWCIYNYKSSETEYEDSDCVYVSATSDGGFFYALICRKGIGWCLDAYRKADDDFTGTTYEFNGIKYNLDEPLSSYQLTFADPASTPCFAYKADDGAVHIGKALRITKTKNLIKDSFLGDEMKSLEGYWYLKRGKKGGATVTDNVFIYWGKADATSYDAAFYPRYVYSQFKGGADTFDSSTEGWNKKNTISAIVGYFNNGIYGIEHYYLSSLYNPSFLED